MNYRLDVASLIVDLKGFPSRELRLPKDGFYCQFRSSTQQTMEHLRKKLFSNWVLYDSSDMVELDFCLGELARLLNQTAADYELAANDLLTCRSEELRKMQLDLEEQLVLLLACRKRAEFYEIPLELKKMYRRPHGIGVLLSCCDNFRVLELLSEVLVYAEEEQETRILTEDEENDLTRLAEALAGLHQIVGGVSNIFQKEWELPTSAKIYKTGNTSIDLVKMSLEKRPTASVLLEVQHQSKLTLTDFDRTTCWLLINVLKHQHNLDQLKALLQLFTNVSRIHRTALSSIRIPSSILSNEAIKVIVNWKRYGAKQPFNIKLNHCCPVSAQLLAEYVCGESTKLQPEILLNYIACCASTCSDANLRKQLQQLIKSEMERFQKQQLLVRHAEHLFEVYAAFSLDMSELYQCYLFALKQLFQEGTDWRDLDIFEVERGFMYFFRWFLSEPTEDSLFIPHFKHIINHTLLALLKGRMQEAAPGSKDFRLTHMIFNQALYFSLQIEGFSDYLMGLFNEPEVFKLFVWVLKRLNHNNQLLFKMNFKFIHKLVAEIYERHEETALRNLEIVQLYWETAAKFLLMWGPKSYLQEEMQVIKEHYDVLRAKVIDLVPHINKAHNREEESVRKYIARHREDYNPRYMQHWLFVVQWKQRMFFEHTIHAMLFVKEELSHNHLRSLMKFMLGLCSPLTVCKMPSAEPVEGQTFFDDVDTLTSEFALEVLECMQSFVQKWEKINFGWLEEAPPMLWTWLWQDDRQHFLTLLCSSNGPSVEQYDCLTQLRRLENHLQLYNNLMDKFSDKSREEFKIIGQIEAATAQICDEVWTQLWEALNRSCVESFHERSSKFRRLRDDANYSEHYRQLEQQTRENLLLPSSNGCFEKQHIINAFQFVRLSKHLLDNTVHGNSALFEKLTQERIRRPFAVKFAGKPILYCVIARCIELIRTIENYFVCSNEQEKQIKCNEFVPMQLSTVASLTTSFNHLTLQFSQLDQDLYTEGLGELLVKQLKKYFTVFLLHDLLEMNSGSANFAHILSAHMNLHLSMLGFASTVHGFYEDTHSCYVEVLEKYVKGLLRPIPLPPKDLEVRKHHTCQFILNVFNMFLHCTFKLSCRVRSALFHQLIGMYEKLTHTPKRAFNAAILYYLKLNFQRFIEFDFTDDMKTLLEGDVKDIDRIDPIKIPMITPIKTVCTQAMIINLLSRNNYETLLLGVKCIFANRQGLEYYLRYLVRVSQEIAASTQIDDIDFETIILDVYGSLKTILEPGLEESTHETVFTMLLRILKLLAKTPYPLGEVRSNLTNHIVSLIFTHPTEEAMEQLQTIPTDNIVLQVARYEYQLIKEYRGRLHMLNCLYLEGKSLQIVLDNWPVIVENYQQKSAEETVRELFAKVSVENYDDFMEAPQPLPKIVASLIDSFAEEFESLQSESSNEEIHVHTKLRTLTGLMIKLPSLISPIVNYRIKHPSLTFIDFLLKRVLSVNYQLVAETIMTLLKTNGGFETTEQGVLVSQNFLLNCSVQSSLIDIVSKPVASCRLHYINAVKLVELLVGRGQSSLFGIYLRGKKANLSESVQNYQQDLLKSLRSKLMSAVLSAVLSETLATSCLMPLFHQLLHQQLLDCPGFDAKENLTYAINAEFLQIIKDKTAQEPKKLAFVEPPNKEIVVLETQHDQHHVKNFDEPQNLFVHRRYCALDAEQRAILTQSSKEITKYASELALHSQLSKQSSNANSRLCLVLMKAVAEESSLGVANITAPTLQSPSAEDDGSQECFNMQDGFIMEDGIIDDIAEEEPQSAPVSVMPSSFEQLHEDYCMENASVLTEDTPIHTPSFVSFPAEEGRGSVLSNMLQSENNTQAIYKRVQKLDLMADLEMGVDVSRKIQFLSNDELEKMILVSDGRLLLGLQTEKQKRGLIHKTTKSTDEVDNTVRYLNELYVGCRVNPHVQELLNNNQTIIPELQEKLLINILNVYMSTVNMTTQETIRKVIGLLSLNSCNLAMIAQFSMFILALSEQQAQLLQTSSVAFPKVQESHYQSSLVQSLPDIKVRMVRLVAHLFQQKIGLPIWLYAEYSHQRQQLVNLSQTLVTTQASKLFNNLELPEQNCSLIDLVLRNVASSRVHHCESYKLLAECIHNHFNECEKKSNDGYPYAVVTELENFHQADIELFAVTLLKEVPSTVKGSLHNTLLKLLLQLYPGCYEPFMAQFMRMLGEELRFIVEDMLKHFRNFRVAFGLKPQTTHEINRDKGRLSKLVESYLCLCREKQSNGERRLEQLQSLLTEVCFDVVPWFREWRFQVENRTENFEFMRKIADLKKTLVTYRSGSQFEQVEKAEQEKLRESLEFATFKSKKINEFISDYLRPVHQAVSVGLFHGFAKAHELLEMMTGYLIPTEDRVKIVAPAYKKISNVWKAAIAFNSLNSDEEVVSYHTMSNLQTRQALKSKTDVGLKSSSIGLPATDTTTKRRRSSARLSINTVNPFSIDKIVQKLLKHTTVMACFIEEGSKLTPFLSKHGGLEVKLRTLRRSKSGIIKEIEIDREKVWFDTLMAIDEEFANKDVRIRFRNEMGLDYGGLTKEWLTLITKELFNPMFGLFELSANRLTIQPSRTSHLVPNHLMHFRKLGMLVGKALIEGWNLEINFTRSFLKHLLGCTLYVEDLEDIDPETCRSLLWILDNEVDQNMELTFCYNTTILGNETTVVLCENGENVLVNESNKKEYVKLLCRSKMTDQIRSQSKAFMEGLQSIIPYNILRHISYKELGLYLAGMPVINLAEMRQHAKCHGFTHNDKIIEWFWLALHDFDQEMLANFLFFLTGSFKVPYGGFKDYPIVLNKVNAKNHLPVAHTCFNTLDLSDYTDRKTLAAKLFLSIGEGQGFNVV